MISEAALCVAFLSVMAQVAGVAADTGWEDKSIKALLIAAVLYLVRELAKQRDSDKAEARSREEKMTAALNATAEALSALRASTETQTDYFKVVAQTIIERDVQLSRTQEVEKIG